MEKLKPAAWDERRYLIIPGNFTTTLTFCIEHFIYLCSSAIKDHGKFFVALSGGSTPKALFEHLAQPPYKSQIDWKNVVLFWSDERSVAPTDPSSNYKMAMDAGLKNMGIPTSQIHRMVAEEDIEKNAVEYEKTIIDVLKTKPFDLVMLGMGDDGHTASLFPHTDGLKVSKRLITANFIPQHNTWRMTFTFDGIHHSNNIAIYVLGATKKYMLAKVLSTPDQFDLLPSQRVGTKDHKALWIADFAAATEVEKKLPS